MKQFTGFVDVSRETLYSENMPKNITVGRSGEDAACRYLIGNGYRIIERNFQRPWGELDIIAIEPKTKILAFIEVKTLAIRQSTSRNIAGLPDERANLRPEDNLTYSKLEKLKRTASLYAGHRPELVSDSGWRIDLVAVELTDSDSIFRHYQNIVA